MWWLGRGRRVRASFVWEMGDIEFGKDGSDVSECGGGGLDHG